MSSAHGHRVKPGKTTPSVLRPCSLRRCLLRQQRTLDARRLAENGNGAWFGTFKDGHLMAQLGVFSDASGIARYQNVETHPAWRRQGLAGTLVWHVGRWALDQLGARTLVIVADPGAGAIRVHRSVGFAGTESQIGFQRAPYTAT